MSRSLLLARHPPVADALRGCCYGSSDVPLADDGSLRIREMVAGLMTYGPIGHVYHSGLTRCAAVAHALADRSGVIPVVDSRLRERCFGTWELRRWDDIHAQSSSDIVKDRLVRSTFGSAKLVHLRAPGKARGRCLQI
jgi:alpha-ribazole phosphatase